VGLSPCYLVSFPCSPGLFPSQHDKSYYALFKLLSSPLLPTRPIVSLLFYNAQILSSMACITFSQKTTCPDRKSRTVLI